MKTLKRPDELSEAEKKRLERVGARRGRNRPSKVPARLVRTSAFAPKRRGLITDSNFERLYVFSGLFEAIAAKIERGVRNPKFLGDYLPMHESPGASSFTFGSLPSDLKKWDQRSTWGVSFLMRTVDFIIHHEFAHLFRFHHLLLPRHERALAIDEALAAMGRGLGNHRRRMIELDADAYALENSLIVTCRADFQSGHPPRPSQTRVAERSLFSSMHSLIAYDP